MAQPTSRQLGIWLACLAFVATLGGAAYRFLDAFATDKEVARAIKAEAVRLDGRIDATRELTKERFDHVAEQLSAINKKLDQILGLNGRSGHPRRIEREGR